MNRPQPYRRPLRRERIFNLAPHRDSTTPSDSIEQEGETQNAAPNSPEDVEQTLDRE